MRPVRVLVVDDEPSGRHALAELLRDEGYDVAEAEGGGQALAQLETFPAQVIVTDFRMPGMNGLELLRQVRQRHGGIGAVLVSAYEPPEAGQLRALPTPTEYLDKPLEIAAVVDSVERVRRAA